MSAISEVLNTAVSSTPWGQVLGLVGSLGTGIIGLFKAKGERAERALERAHELGMFAEKAKLLIAQGNVDAATLAGEVAKIREGGASAAFTSSIEAEAKLPRSYRWIDAFRAFTRPGLTWYFTWLFTAGSMCIIRGLGAEYFAHPLTVFCFVTCANLMEMSVTWWFGQRQMDKMTTSWGNAMVNAKVSGSATSKPSINVAN